MSGDDGKYDREAKTLKWTEIRAEYYAYLSSYDLTFGQLCYRHDPIGLPFPLAAPEGTRCHGLWVDCVKYERCLDFAIMNGFLGWVCSEFNAPRFYEEIDTEEVIDAFIDYLAQLDQQDDPTDDPYHVRGSLLPPESEIDMLIDLFNTTATERYKEDRILSSNKTEKPEPKQQGKHKWKKQ